MSFSVTGVQELFKQINKVVQSKEAGKRGGIEGLHMAEDPASIPIKWRHYYDKYGLYYQLCDNSISTLSNDNTRLLLASNGE